MYVHEAETNIEAHNRSAGQKSDAFYGTRMFVAVLTKYRHHTVTSTNTGMCNLVLFKIRFNIILSAISLCATLKFPFRFSDHTRVCLFRLPMFTTFAFCLSL